MVDLVRDPSPLGPPQVKLTRDEPKQEPKGYGLKTAVDDFLAPAKSSWQALKNDVSESAHSPSELDRFTSTGKSMLDTLGLVTSPISGAINAAVARPVGEGLAWIPGVQLPGQSHEQAVDDAMHAVDQSVAAARPVGGTPIMAPKAVAAPAPPASDARTLIDSGVRLTPGQQASASAGNPVTRFFGTGAKEVEDTVGSAPLVGRLVKHARDISIGDFRKATANKVLEPIGEKLSAGAKSGRDVITEAGQKVGGAYDEILPTLTYKTDAQHAADMAKVEASLARLPKERADQVRGIIQDSLTRRLGPDGSMDGASFKAAERELSAAAGDYGSPTASADERVMARALKSVRDAMWDSLERVNPQHAQRLSQIDKSYAMLARMQSAAGRGALRESQFTPSDLLYAIKQADKSTRDVRFAEGKEPLQDWAETAHRVLPSEGAKNTAHSTVGSVLGGASPPLWPFYTGPGMSFLNKLTGARLSPQFLRAVTAESEDRDQ